MCVCENIMCMVCSVVLCACSVDNFKELRASKANSSNGVDKLKSFFRILDPIYVVTLSLIWKENNGLVLLYACVLVLLGGKCKLDL